METNYILYLKTFQAQTFKSVIDALKEILNDTNFEFDEEGLRIIAMDNSHVVGI
jgi:proliferating cell nuclear antigen